MRTLKISLVFWGLLVTAPASAADGTADSSEETPPPQMKLGGADPRAPGPLTVPPAEITLPPTGQPLTDDLTFDYHGYFRVPFAMSLGKRANPVGDQAGTTFHMPAVVPDYPAGTWLNSNNIPTPWATALFSYGNKTVTGTVGVAAFNFTASQDSAMTNNAASVSLGPVYLHFNLPQFLGTKARVDWDVGAFGNRYGAAGKYDYGKYGMFLFGATGAIGETVGAEYDFGPTTVRVEHGLGGNYYVDNKYASTLLHHAHGFLGYKQTAKLGLHYMTAWTTDERNPPVQPSQADGRLSVIGADARFNGGVFGELYFGAAQAKAIHALHVSPILYTMNALGGAGMRDNYLGSHCVGSNCAGDGPIASNDVNGSVTSILFQYDYSFAALARYLSRYPRAYWTDGPELALSLFGTMSFIKSSDPAFDGQKKAKFGSELTYSPIPWLSIGGRFDRVLPWSNDTAQNFSVITPKIYLKTSFFSHEVVTIQYSRYFYGGAYPRLASCGSQKDPACSTHDDNLPATNGSVLPGATINDLYGKTLDPSQSGGSYYDKSVIYMSATMWW